MAVRLGADGTSTATSPTAHAAQRAVSTTQRTALLRPSSAPARAGASRSGSTSQAARSSQRMGSCRATADQTCRARRRLANLVPLRPLPGGGRRGRRAEEGRIRWRFGYRQGSRRVSGACRIASQRQPLSSRSRCARSSRSCRRCRSARPTRACWPRASSACGASSVAEGGGLVVDRRRVDPLAAIRTDLEHDAFASLRAFAEARQRPPGPDQVAADRADHPRPGPGAGGRAGQRGLRRRRPGRPAPPAHRARSSSPRPFPPARRWCSSTSPA